MGDNTGIEWTDATWNPVTGCTKVSPGCDNCYAETLAERFRGVPGHHYQNGFDLQLRPELLDRPLRWRRSRRIFVNSMSDLFHADVPDEYIAKVFAVMALAHQHTFQLLTKRHGRMRSLLNGDFRSQVAEEMTELIAAGKKIDGPPIVLDRTDPHSDAVRAPGNVWGPAVWPLPNVWLGVSVEDQQWADIRIPALLGTPAAVRFLSMEPLLGPVDLSRLLDPERDCACSVPAMEGAGQHAAKCPCVTQPEIDWVIVGGESGHGARPMHPNWVRDLRNQCTRASVPFLFKQWGEWQDGSAEHYGQKGEDHIIVFDGRHEPAKDHWAIDPKTGWHTSELIRARARNERGTQESTFISRVGKKAAGRELDGRTWDEFPEAVTIHA